MIRIFFHDFGVNLYHDDFRKTLDNIDAAKQAGENIYIISDIATMREYIEADDARIRVDNLVSAYEALGKGEEAQAIIDDIKHNGQYHDLAEMWKATRSALFDTYETLTI